MDFLPGGRIPNLELTAQVTFPASLGEELTVLVECHVENHTLATRQGLDQRIRNPREPALKVPDPNGLIIPSRSELPAIGAERHAPDGSAVVKGEGFLPRFSFQRRGVPQADGPVVARRDEPRPVGTKVHAA